jgi:plastocyanin
MKGVVVAALLPQRVLLLEIGLGLVLLVGAALARARKFGVHGVLQSAVVLLNVVIVFLAMVPSFRLQVLPDLGSGHLDGPTLLAAVHALFGTAALLLGVYVITSASNLLPQRFRFTNYRRWMRATLAVWWIALFLGAATYRAWSGSAQTDSAVAASESGAATLSMKNFSFTPAEIKVAPGTTIEWVDEGGRHAVNADDDSFKSETLVAGGKFSRTFDKPGTYRYFCPFHGEKGGKDMAGTIVVEAHCSYQEHRPPRASLGGLMFFLPLQAASAATKCSQSSVSTRYGFMVSGVVRNGFRMSTTRG